MNYLRLNKWILVTMGAVLLFSSLSCGLFYLLRRTSPDVGEKLSTMHTVRTFEGDARGFYTKPEIILAESVNYYDPNEYGTISYYSSEETSLYNGCLTVRNQEDWIQLETKQGVEAVGVQFYGDYEDGWARLYLDGDPIWQADTHFENCPVDAAGNRTVNPDVCQGGFIVYVQVEHLSTGDHTLRVVNAGGGHITVCFFGVGAGEPYPPPP